MVNKITFLLLLLVLSHAQEEPLSIFSVTDDPQGLVSPARTSLRGGKMIYIKVNGHSPNPNDNLIYIGGMFPCIVPSDGVTEISISCETSDTGTEISYNNMPVTIISYGIPISTFYPNTVYYQSDKTPRLKNVYPSAGIADSLVSFYGTHRITDLGDGRRFLGDIRSLKIGNDICSTFDLVQDEISASSDAFIKCRQSFDQEAGKYNVSQKVIVGYADRDRYMRKSSFTPGEYFEYTVLPTVKTVSPDNGNVGGQYLTISGTGFSANPANNTVKVDGNDCKVTKASTHTIECTLASRDPAKATLLSTNASTQQNGYFSGAGLKYARFTYSTPINTMAKFVAAVRAGDAASLGTPQETGFRAELRETSVYSKEAQTWSGYFTAPVDGDYTFRGIADDWFQFYISTEYGSTGTLATPLISSSTNQYQENFWMTDIAAAEATVTLVAGKSYYIEAYHINAGGPGHFDIAVQVPNTNKDLLYQTYQVDKVITNSTIQPEILLFTIDGASQSGTIQLYIYKTDPTTLKVTEEKYVNVTYGASASTFQSALKQFSIFSSYYPTVARTIKDASDNVLNNLTGATKIEYQVTIMGFRPQAAQSEQLKVNKYGGFTGTVTQTRTQTHSPLLSGFFGLTIAGQPIQVNSQTAIPYNVQPSVLQTAIRTSGIADFGSVEVKRTSMYDDSCGYSCTWIIMYRGFNNTVPNIQASSVGLSGGLTYSISASTRRAYSSNIVFDPVDYRFLHTYASQPNVLVSTNGVPSICTGTCGYTFNTLCEITSLSKSGNTLSFALSDPTTVGFAANAVTVRVSEQPCSVDGGSTPGAMSCTMTVNTDTTPLIVVEDVVPLVYVKPLGIIGLGSGVSPLSVGLVTSSLSVTTGGNNGGFLIKLNGAGFPLDKSQMEITICGNKGTITAISNIEATFYVPSCPNTGAETVTVKVGALTASSLTFTYTDGSATAPTITNLSPNSANPGLKGILQISGSRFGTDKSIVSVFLSNSTGKIYQLNIYELTDTYIKVGLSGGLEGTFTVQVNHQTYGDSIAGGANTNIFNYKFSVSSISPTSGSYNGGTLLTITGENFSTDTQNTLVYVGDTLNWFCTIESITATQIKCRTPAISRFYKVGVPVNVVVSTRLLILNSCTGTCEFTYDASEVSPTLTGISVATSREVTLTGINLLDGNNFAQVSVKNTLTGTTTVYQATTSTATQVKFSYTTSLTSGTYEVKVRNIKGESNAKSMTVNWSVGTVSWASGGSTAGGVVSISNGAGYPSSIDGKAFSIQVLNGDVPVDFSIVSCCTSNSMSLYLAGGADGTTYSLKFTSPVNSGSKIYTLWDSSTPKASITSATTVSVGSNSITFGATNSVAATITGIKLVSTFDSTQVITIANGGWTTTGTGASASTTFSATLTSGNYKLQVSTSDKGNILITDTISVDLPANPSTANQQISFNGGFFTITAPNLSPVSYITVNGFKGKITQYSNSFVTYQVPALVAANTQSTFGLRENSELNLKQFTFFSDQDPTANNVSKTFDGLTNTLYGSNNTDCYIGLDAGQGVTASVNRFRFFPNFNWTNTAKKILFAQFQGSNDKSSWTTLGTVDQTVHSGWNVIRSTDTTTAFRYLRFKHNSTSQCNIAQIQVFGIFQTSLTVSLTSQTADVIYNDGGNTKTFTGAIEYRQDKTATVTNISPRYGDIAGGYTVTLTGTNLDAGTPKITIDGIDCPIGTSTATTITCTPGARSITYTQENTFTVTLGKTKAILKDSFLYVTKWSSATTWGADMPPVDNDLIYVTKGTSLLVDQNTPILEGIAVQGGNLIFSDDLDLTVRAGFITMNGGRFIAGTEKHPHTHKLNFIMYGGYYGKQQPMFGNKGIGCMNCKFSMYGVPRPVTWTRLASTIEVGHTTLTVQDTIDWTVGEQIVIASTSFVREQAERRKIASISGNTITVDSAFNFRHVSIVETYGTKKLAMQAEVGLLTRNIKMQGDESSAVSQYGSHLLLHGQTQNGFQGHIGYSEFTNCGQPQILGRYCMHFHMAGDVPTSFARGNAVHDSFARVITIHGVHHLTVEDNVGHIVKGHNFFVEDGIETHNLIKHNLAVETVQTTRMLQTDTSSASFWITNPTNDVIDNAAAGGDFYGFWYQIKEHPDGPSATNDVCPEGNPLGTVSGNTAHSNKRFGLRIFVLSPRMYPCDPVHNTTDPDDIWSYNPSQQAVFTNFTVYKNLEDGVLAEEVGDVVIDNFVIAENYHSGMEWYQANFTKTPPSIRDSVIIGSSVGNAHADTTNYTSGMSGVITGKTGTYSISNVDFYNYPTGSVLFRTCRFCDDLLKYTNLGTEVIVNQVSINNVTGKMLFMIGMKRDVIFDTDGSLSNSFDQQSRASATIVHGWNHIASYHQNTCPGASDSSKWDNAIMCGPSIGIKRIFFTALTKHDLFIPQKIKVMELGSLTQTINPNMSSTLYTAASQRLIDGDTHVPKKEQKWSWSLPYVIGQTYNVWWGTGIDFEHLAIVSATPFTQAQAGVIFKFNYTENRELFEIGPMRGGIKKLKPQEFVKAQTSQLDANTCNNGDYFLNNEQGPNRMLTVCQSGKNRTRFEYTQVNGVKCRYLCPLPAGTFIKENFTREWSNATQWPNGVVPQPGDNITVNGNWTVLLDVDPSYLNNLTIDGTLVADDTRDINITANFIHIRAGNVTFGSTGKPFTHKVTFQINSLKADNGFVIDPIIAGNKHFVVTGVLSLHGISPSTVTTTLSQTAIKGSSTIKVSSKSDWVVGDTIVLSPSFATHNEYQTKTIQAINADGSITLSSALAYTHYGAGSVTINNEYGTIDTRTRVGHINRNIQFVAGPDSGWGYTVVVYGFLDGDILRIGSADLTGVQFNTGGQYDTMNAPLNFINLKNGSNPSSVKATSFSHCQASCIYVSNSQGITISNNVFYRSYIHHFRMLTSTGVIFENNLMIGVDNQPTLAAGSKLVSCVYVEKYIAPGLASVKNNYCLGSPQHGFAVPFHKCGDEETNPMANNTVGASKIGFIIDHTMSDNCQSFSYAKAFATQIGQICGPGSITSVKLDHFIMVDNGRGATLKLGGSQGKNDHSAFMSNSYINPISRPTCAQCYGSNAIPCTGRIGMRMFTASANSEHLPNKFGSGFDVICKQPLYNSKSFLTDNRFQNFKQTYTGAIASCGSNFAFKPHSGARDQVGSVNLYTSECKDCDSNSYLSANEPSQAELGWFGGCGDIVCTGFYNYIVQDFTGTFFGQKASVIPNNTNFGNNEAQCTYSAPMNSYYCKRSDFGVLEYQNVAADQKKRIMWPVTMTYQGSNYSTVTNGWRQWQWLGNEPLNQRFGRFVTLVRQNQVYNMTFASEPPHKLQVQFQRKSTDGNNANYLVIKLHYPRPNSIRLLKNNQIVDPILLTDLNNTTPGLKENINTSICGSHVYFYTNYTIHFVVTQALDCLLQIELTESIQLTTHFAMNISDFFSSNSTITNFINNLCALLNIRDTSRVKIVGVFSGSVNVTTVITPSSNSSDPSVTATSAAIDASISSGALATAFVSFAPLIGASSTYYSLDDSTKKEQQTSKLALIIGVAVAGVILVIASIVTAVCCMRRRAKVVEEVMSHQDEYVQEKQTNEKANNHFMMNNQGSDLPNESEIKIKSSHKQNRNALKVHELGQNSEIIDN